MRLRHLLAAATCFALPLAAQGQPITGPYVSLAGGFNILNPVNGTLQGRVQNLSIPPGHFNDRFQFRPGYAGTVGAGYGFGNGFRVELDGDYNRNSVHADDYRFIGLISLNGRFTDHGAAERYGAMVNVLYDIPVGLPVFPYVGAGAGYQWVKLNRDITQFPGFLVGRTQGSFAYDIIAGVSYPLPMLPQLAITAEYRFTMLTASQNYSTNLPIFFRGASSFKEHLGQQSSDTFTVGLRYQIFAPPMMAPAVTPAPAPVAAAPAPVPAKTYLVFFDWNQSSLTPRATQIIAQAAVDSHRTAITTIDVSGYTDTSGTPSYNQGLSMRRAQSVAAQLVADGVPAAEIETFAYGETHLLVPTGPGVREPQNRRVEIVLQ